MAEKLYTRFPADYDFSNKDYVIIGSGIGGLTTAIFLAKAGKKVVVLERHYVAGGFSHTFKRKDGFVWDVGVHYVGNMDKDSQLKVLFNYLTDNKLEWEFMGDIYDKVLIGGEEYIFRAGRENQRKQLYGYFPEDKIAIDQYFELIEKAVSRARLYFAEKILPLPLKVSLGRIFSLLFKPYASVSTYDKLKTITHNEKLISVLCSQCGNYGLPPRKSSFAAHALVVNHFLEGGYYPVGGADQISRKMIATLNTLGGEVFIKANVEEIVTDKNRVKGIRLNGNYYNCRKIISNAGARNTYFHLLKSQRAKEYMESMKKIEPSTSHICLYVGLNRSDADLDLPRYNVWYYDHYNIDDILNESLKESSARTDFAYISFPSAKDPDWSKKHPDSATIQLIVAGNYEWFRKYENEPWRNRGDVYEKKKEDLKEKMLHCLLELFPQIKDHIACCEVSTPLSTRHFMNYRSGEIYGLAHSPERFDNKTLRPKSSVKGLYLVGQDISVVGVAGALTSGILCAIEILRFGIQRQFKAMAKNNSGRA